MATDQNQTSEIPTAGQPLADEAWCLVRPTFTGDRLEVSCIGSEVEYVQEDAIEIATVGQGSRPGETWKDLAKKGYRIVRVRIEEINT